MYKTILFLLHWTLLGSCNTVTSKVEKMEKPHNDTLTTERNYSIFHDKLTILSPVKPYEEDATNTVSKLALSAYTDIKKYSFMPLLKKGMVLLTVSEFKDADSSFNAAQHLKEIIEVSESNESISINYGPQNPLENNAFSGFWSIATTTFEGKESSSMYLNVMTDKKIIITTLAVFELEDDLNIIKKLVVSIGKKQ